MTARDKRLARFIEKLLTRPQSLKQDPKGNFEGADHGGPKLRLPAGLARYAISRGLLQSDEKRGLIVTDAAPKWIKRTKSGAATPIASGNIFGSQHWDLAEREIFDASGDLVLVHANVEDSPLLRLYRQLDGDGIRFLSEAEFAAGEKFRQDYARSAMGRMSASNWGSVRQGNSAARAAFGADHGTGAALDARRRVMDALGTVGPVLDRVLFALLVREQEVRILETDLSWPKRSGKIVLKIALSRLARHYGLS
jgi:hypothetical protein